MSQRKFMTKGVLLTNILLLTIQHFAYSQKFNIVDFGAKPDNRTINTSYIQRAIDSCFATGGGTVYIPTGTFVTGTFELKSNVNLELEAGAVLKGSSNMEDYKPYQSPIFHVPTHYGIIFAHKAQNVSITGHGTISGNDDAFFFWDQVKKIEWSGLEYTRQKDNFRKVESGTGDGPVVPKPDRPRQMIIFSECTNVTVRDIMLIKSPFWTLHFADCDGVVATGLKIWGSLEVPNNDGIDITSCNNVIISNCDIRTGDDAIVVTGYAYHFELPGYNNLRHPCENFVISNCNLQSRSSAIRIGFMDQNSIRNININNINITNTNRGIGIFVRDEGSIENVTISQVTIHTRLHTGDWWGNAEPIHISAVQGTENGKLGKIRNITFRDITCFGENGILIYGTPQSIIEDVFFTNLKFTLVKSRLNGIAGGNIDLRGAYGNNQIFASDIAAFFAQHVKNLSLNRVVIDWEEVEEDYFKYGIHIKAFSDVQLSWVKATPAPSNKKLPAIRLENGRGYDLKNLSEVQIQKVNARK